MNAQDMTRSDLTILMWQWLDADYAELMDLPMPGSVDTKVKRSELRGRCQAYARAIAFLAGISEEAVRERVAERRRRAGRGTGRG